MVIASGVIPEGLAKAVVQPLLKKTTLDPLITATYRPVSNVPFL
jgi:hypothetical protein